MLFKWNFILVLGYYICEVGVIGVQEFVFMFVDGFYYVEKVLECGLDIDEFVLCILFFWDIYNDFFEEIVKLCVVCCIWVWQMCDCYGVKNFKSWMLCIYLQIVGVLLFVQQLLNNIVCVVIQVFVVVLGGMQSFYIDVFDEVLVLFIEESVVIVLCIQQIIVYEIGVVGVVDLLVGSYYVEKLMNDIEVVVMGYIEQICMMGGVEVGIDNGFFQFEMVEVVYCY